MQVSWAKKNMEMYEESNSFNSTKEFQYNTSKIGQV